MFFCYIKNEEVYDHYDTPLTPPLIVNDFDLLDYFIIIRLSSFIHTLETYPVLFFFIRVFCKYCCPRNNT
jgi:hypothetical protein